MKLVRIITVFALLISLCACGSNNNTAPQQAIIRVTEPTAASEEQPEEVTAEPEEEVSFSTFTIDGKEIELGGALDLSILPEVNSVYEVPSCAIEGTDLVHSFTDYEITAYDDGTKQIIYSVYFLTPDIATTEGLSLGDPFDKMISLYGENYEENGTACIYSCNGMTLNILIQNGTVISIEYRWEFN